MVPVVVVVVQQVACGFGFLLVLQWGVAGWGQCCAAGLVVGCMDQGGGWLQLGVGVGGEWSLSELGVVVVVAVAVELLGWISGGGEDDAQIGLGLIRSESVV